MAQDSGHASYQTDANGNEFISHFLFCIFKSNSQGVDQNEMRPA